jgi:Flp pilus assembly pilin Flp
MKSKTLHTVVKDEKGVAALEFALIFPVIMIAIFGSAELLMQIYIRSNIHLFTRQAARDSIVGAARLSIIEDTLRRKIETLPGLKKGQDLEILICQQDGCNTRISAISELTGDINNNDLCDAGETYTDFNRNGLPEKIGASISGNSLGGPNDPVIIQVETEANFFFGSLTFLGEVAQAAQVQKFNVRAIGTNEDFASPVITCT